jgi:hypothetical protein
VYDEPMRRLCATLLLTLFSFLLGGPALFADPDSNLPACCRRLGQHHCSLVSPAQTGGLALQPVLCAAFPNASATPASAKAGLRKLPDCVAGPLTERAAITILSSVPYRALTRDAHPERGPPALLS